MAYSITLHKRSYSFADLKTLMAKASPFRTGDALAGIAAGSNEERVAAQYLLAELPLQVFLEQLLIPYESDEISRLIIDSHDVESFAPIAGLSVAELRHWLLNPEVDALMLRQVAKGLSPEMLAAVSKIMRNQDLIAVAQKCEVQSKFRTTVGLKNRLSVRLQPNHPTDNNQAILASILDGLLYGCGDALIGINPATDSPEMLSSLLIMLDELRQKFEIPTQSCVLSHVSTTMQVMHKAPVDLVFQSIGGTEKTNSSFGINLAMLAEAQQAALELGRGQGQVMYFETGQGSSLSANAHHGIDQQTCEARAYAVARNFNPFLVNSVVGFIGPEYLFDGKQILRAALEDHFCAKLMGLPMGMDVCYTNHADADQDDVDSIMTLLGLAGCNFFMGVPGADDIMLNYQSTSYHDALYLRKVLQKKPAPEFEQWLLAQGIINERGERQIIGAGHKLLSVKI